MFAPVFNNPIFCNVIIGGNDNIRKYIEEETNNCIKQGLNLYEAQKLIINNIKDTYGEDWYEKSAYAVNFIIENEYCHHLRKEQPYIDKRSYEYNHSSTLY